MLLRHFLNILVATVEFSNCHIVKNTFNDPQLQHESSLVDGTIKTSQINYSADFVPQVKFNEDKPSFNSEDVVSAKSDSIGVNGQDVFIQESHQLPILSETSPLDSSFPPIRNTPVLRSGSKRYLRKVARSPVSQQTHSLKPIVGEFSTDSSSDFHGKLSSDPSGSIGTSQNMFHSAIQDINSFSHNFSSNDQLPQASGSSMSVSEPIAVVSSSNSYLPVEPSLSNLNNAKSETYLTVGKTEGLSSDVSVLTSNAKSEVMKSQGPLIDSRQPVQMEAQNLKITELSKPEMDQNQQLASPIAGSGRTKLTENTSNLAPSVALLKLPNSTVFAVPGYDTPAQPVNNFKRAIQRPRPLLRKKSLKNTPELPVQPVNSDVSEVSNLASPQEQPPQNITVPQSDAVVNTNQQGPAEKTPVSSVKAPRITKKLKAKPVVQQPSSPNASPQLSASVASPQTAAPADVEAASTPIQSDGSPAVKDVQQAQVPCTCGVFLSGQFTKGTSSEPDGNPVVENQLGQTFPCTAAGKNQCQNKCIDMMVKHLPNSAAIICGSVNRDVYKEKAYLWVKNCQDVWVNSNLSSGKEHCCKDNQPIKCAQMT